MLGIFIVAQKSTGEKENLKNNSFQLWLEFELWEKDYNPDEEFFNMTVILENGAKYALNVWTYKFLERTKKENAQSSKSSAGKYLIPPDLLIEKLDRVMIQKIIADLLQQNLMKKEWLVINNDSLSS